MVERHIIERVQQRLISKNLPISVKFWNGTEVRGRTPSKIALSLRSPRNLALLARPTLGNLAQSYVEEDIDLDGDIRDMVELLTKYFDVGGDRVAAGSALAERLRRLRRHSRSADRRAIASHYDVSNEFYALWLDPRRIYSCAYFRHEDDTLAAAQEQKLEHICRKLNLQPGERFLDIGCGWGGLLLWAVERHGVHALGITLSENQRDHVERVIAERGLSDRCTVRLMDYRDLPEEQPFDKIASVGMFEHVGLSKLPLYFSKIQRLLRPGGLVMNHGITSAMFNSQTLANDIRDFIDRYVFPDGELTHISKVIEIMARQGLEVRDVESLRPHYVKTLWHWVDRLEVSQEAARALVGEKKYRIWRAYMAGCAYAFEVGWHSIYQVLGGRPLANGVLPYPLTREHVYSP